MKKIVITFDDSFEIEDVLKKVADSYSSMVEFAKLDNNGILTGIGQKYVEWKRGDEDFHEVGTLIVDETDDGLIFELKKAD